MTVWFCCFIVPLWQGSALGFFVCLLGRRCPLCLLCPGKQKNNNKTKWRRKNKTQPNSFLSLPSFAVLISPLIVLEILLWIPSGLLPCVLWCVTGGPNWTQYSRYGLMKWRGIILSLNLIILGQMCPSVRLPSQWFTRIICLRCIEIILSW